MKITHFYVSVRYRCLDRVRELMSRNSPIVTLVGIGVMRDHIHASRTAPLRFAAFLLLVKGCFFREELVFESLSTLFANYKIIRQQQEHLSYVK